MSRNFLLALAATLLAFPDVPVVYRFNLQSTTAAPDPSLPALSVFHDLFQAVAGQKPSNPGRLRPESELAIVRYVDGEFARVVKPIPGGKKGFHVQPGSPLDDKVLRQALTKTGAAANPGDTVQITRIGFREKQLIIDINGGGRPKHHWRDHLQIGIGSTMPSVSTSQEDRASSAARPGATLYLDFGHPVPDMSPDDLKKILSAFLDFSKERSAALQWVDTLPPEFKEAIKDRRAVVGMDQEMVIAAIGRPDRKVRERNDLGQETEDWIYGQPPAKTVFVTFIGDKVVRVRQFP